MRKARNKAVHENYEKPCGLLLEFAYVLSEWFMQTYGDYRYEHRPFILPKKKIFIIQILKKTNYSN